jgi:ribosomal protein L37AE/L43A
MAKPGDFKPIGTVVYEQQTEDGGGRINLSVLGTNLWECQDCGTVVTSPTKHVQVCFVEIERALRRVSSADQLVGDDDGG